MQKKEFRRSWSEKVRGSLGTAIDGRSGLSTTKVRRMGRSVSTVMDAKDINQVLSGPIEIPWVKQVVEEGNEANIRKKITSVQEASCIDSFGRDMLMVEAMKPKPNITIFKILLLKGASSQHADQMGWTVLHWLCKCSADLGCVEYLVKGGADKKAVNNDGSSAVHYLARRSPTTPAEIRSIRRLLDLFLLDGLSIDYQNRNGETYLHSAAAYANAEMINLLLARSANPNLSNRQGMTPLHLAVIAQRIDVIKALLPVSQEVGGDREKSPLAIARTCKGPRSAAIVALLEAPRTLSKKEAAVLDPQAQPPHQALKVVTVDQLVDELFFEYDHPTNT